MDSSQAPPPLRNVSFGVELRGLLGIAVPLLAAQVASVALPLTDAIYMGRLDRLALAGGGLASTLLATAVLIGGSALGGLSPRVAKAHATSDTLEVAVLVRHARWLGLVIAALVGLLALCGEPLLLAARQTSDVARAASIYLIPAAASVPFTLGCTIQRGLLAACGRARLVSAAWALAVPLNLVLDHALARGFGPVPAMGLAGVGLATSLVSLAVLVFLMLAGARTGYDGRRFWLGRWVPRVAKDLSALGGPIVLAVAAEAGAFAVAGVAVGWFGDASLAAHRVATVVAHVCFLPPLALSQAATIRVAAGAGTVDGGRMASRVPLGVAVAWALVAGLSAVIGAPLAAIAFLGEGDPALSLTVALIHVVAAFQIVDALQSVAAGVLRGRGDTVTAMRWAVVAYGLVAPAVALASTLGAGLGALGVWLGLAAGLTVAATALVPSALRSR